MTLQLPRLRQDQTTIARTKHKVITVAMGRRWGKTTMAGAVAVINAAEGGIVAWVAPTYSNSRPLWRFVERTIVNEPQAYAKRAERIVNFANGGRLTLYSADNDVSLRGEAFDLVIVDEAARIREETFTDVLLPTLADRDGRIIIISTPKGRNWFWRQYVQGLQPNDYCASFTAPSEANPMASIQKAAQLAKQTVNDRTYKQEWLAQFVDDNAGVFSGIMDCVKEHAKEPQPYKSYVMGVDWGRTNDATVFTIICVEDAQVVCVERMTQTAYAIQIARLRKLYDKWKPYDILAEQNSLGSPLVEALQQFELPVRAFQTTATSKPPLIDALALAIERQDIGLTNDPILISELQAYQSERLPSGTIRFGAPPNMHDDTVISLSLAWKAARHGGRMILFEA